MDIKTMKTLLKKGLNAWKFTRGLTYSMLEHLTVEQLVTPFPRPVYDTFGKHFQELGAVQEAYLDAMKTGRLDFAKFNFQIDEELVKSKTALRRYLESVDNMMEEFLTNELENVVKSIDWGLPDNPSLVEHLNLLNQHETLHHGQFVAYCYLLNIKFPEPWPEVWGLPANDDSSVMNWMQNWKKN